MKGRLVGIVARKKDDGKTSTTLFLDQVGFSPYESTATICKGYKTREVYFAGEVNAEPGDVLNIDYDEGFQGRATVIGVEVIQRKKN